MMLATKTVDAAELGRRLRALRVARREWLHDAAERLGLPSRELSIAERTGAGAVDIVAEHPELGLRLPVVGVVEYREPSECYEYHAGRCNGDCDQCYHDYE